jgi:hypothetical protein
MNRKRAVKIVGYSVGGLIATVLILLIVVWVYIDSIAAKALTSGVETLGEVPCTLDDMSVSLVRGRVSMKGLTIKNPPKFPESDMFRLGEATVDVGVSSVLDRPLHIETLEIREAYVRIDLGLGGSNIKTFLGNIERNSPTGAAPDKPADDKADQPLRIVVDRLVIEDAKVKIGSGFSKAGVPVSLATVELANITGDNGQGVTSGELTGMIIGELVRRGAIKINLDLDELVPKEFVKRMGSIAGSIGSAGVDAVKDVGGAVGGAVKNIFGGSGGKDDE